MAFLVMIHGAREEKSTDFFPFLEQTVSITFLVVADLQRELTLHFRRNLPSYRKFFAEVRKYGSPHLLKANNQHKLSFSYPRMTDRPEAGKQHKKKLTKIQQCPCIWFYISISNLPELLLSQVSHPRSASTVHDEKVGL